MDQSFQRVRPFRFDTVFSIDPLMPVDEHEAGPTEDLQLTNAVLRAELEALRISHAQELAEARAKAVLETENRLRGEREEALLSVADALQAAWEECSDSREVMMDELRAEAVSLALAIGEKLAGHALANVPDAAVDQAIDRVLGLIARGQEVVIRVNPDMIEDVENRIAVRQARDRRKLNLLVEGDSAIPVGDANLRWDGGGMKVNAEERRRAIEEELSSLGIREG